jgi:protein-S-isoprenylcysteine O-methyltransferase Ste14
LVIDLPSAILSAALSAYWSGVTVTAVVNRCRYGRSAGIWPKKRVERLLWPIWVPLIVMWNLLPWLAVCRGRGWLGLAVSAHGYSGLNAVRLLAALVGVGCFLATVVCWMRLGRNWSMAVVPGQKTELVRAGLYGIVRHPIYALSMALMLCSVVVVPTWPMLILTVLHLPFMAIKARSEERFLREAHGERYLSYCRRTGRFFPRFHLASGAASACRY